MLAEFCVNRLAGGKAFLRRPREVMRHFLFKERPLDHLLFQPQHTFVTDGDGRLLADVIGRVEEMQSSYDGICRRLGFASSVLDKVNGSKHGSFRDYYDSELVEGVADLYRRDLELFGYSFEEVMA